MTINEVQAQRIVNAIVNIDYDYICVINVAEKSYIMFNGNQTNRIPDFENHDYDGERIKNTYIYVAEKDREHLLHDMNLDFLQEQLKTAGKFCTEYDQISGNQISHKQDVFFYLDDTHRYMILARKDITDLVNRQQKDMDQLKKALMDAEHAVEAKTTFLSSVSHDLRTPLNGVMGFAYAGKDSESLQEKDHCFRQIIASGELLKQLISDTLDLSRNELGIVLHPVFCNLCQLAGEVMDTISATAAGKKLELKTTLTDAEPSDVCADRTRLQQIMLNLLSNAVKFTSEGGTVELVISHLHTRIHDADYRISVIDNGIGMSREFLPHAFEPFYQQEDIQSDNVKGSRLGLAIVSQDVKAMGGTIDLTSEQGFGTRFDVYLPLSAEEPCTGYVVEAENTPSLAGKRVLVIEDNEINRAVAVMLLEKQHVEVTCTANGADGLRKFRDSSEGFFDTIIMDIRMPVMDGFEASRSLRSLKRADAQTVPIIAMTANIYNSDISEITNAGMDAYIAKPFVPSELYRVIATQIAHGHTPA